MNLNLVNIYILPFIACAGFVTLNEMGDKTQLLAMAFATRIKFIKVMSGVFIATVLNHTLAVAAGSLLARVPGWQGWVQLIASILFIFFGLWSLIEEKSESNSTVKSRFGDVATVTIGFFIAEMGDKTQLATIALSAKYPDFPITVLAGTTLGMLIADAIGIFAGNILNKRLPEKSLKLIAACAFIIFGLVGLWQSLFDNFRLSSAVSALTVGCTLFISLLAGVNVYKKNKYKI